MPNKKNRIITLTCVVWILLAVIVSILSLRIGRYSQISFTEIGACLYDFFLGPGYLGASDKSYSVVVYIRLPRTVAALVVGSALACSGVAYQALFSNPIASPDTLGVTQGSAFGAVLGILIGVNIFFVKLFAFFSGCVVVIGVFFLAKSLSKGRNVTFYLLLSGMIASSFFQSLVSLLKYTADADQKLPQITYWLLGSLSKVTLNDIIPLLVLYVAAIIPLLLFSWRMNLLVLTPEEAFSMGVDIKKLRVLIIICATMLTGISTAVSGCISWYGLLIPHLVRYFVGNDVRKILAISACSGACIMVIMDIIARTVTVQELPISILTSIVGVPMILAMLIKQWSDTTWN